jgi:hypothetical protein
MKKQYIVPLVLFLLGMVITIIGALFKLMHWPGANFMLMIGMLSEAIAIITLIVVLLKKMK